MCTGEVRDMQKTREVQDMQKTREVQDMLKTYVTSDVLIIAVQTTRVIDETPDEGPYVTMTLSTTIRGSSGDME